MPPFISFFGINSSNQGLIAALYVIGNIAGSFFAGPCSDVSWIPLRKAIPLLPAYMLLFCQQWYKLTETHRCTVVV